MKYTGKSLTVNVTELFIFDLGALWGLECCPAVVCVERLRVVSSGGSGAGCSTLTGSPGVSATRGTGTAGSTTSGSAWGAGSPGVASMGISGTGGSLVSDSSGGFTGSQGSGGAVFNTGWGRLLITIISSSSSWGSVGTLLCLALGGIKSVGTMGLVSRHGCSCL